MAESLLRITILGIIGAIYSSTCSIFSVSELRGVEKDGRAEFGEELAELGLLEALKEAPTIVGHLVRQLKATKKTINSW
jgi:hypothetical protein